MMCSVGNGKPGDDADSCRPSASTPATRLSNLCTTLIIGASSQREMDRRPILRPGELFVPAAGVLEVLGKLDTLLSEERSVAATWRYAMESSRLLPGEGKAVALGGHTVRFLHRAANSGYSLIEWMAPPAIPGPPPHVHRVTDEGFYVLEGAFGFQSGEQTIHGPSGTYVFIPKGLVHTYWNQGPTLARLLILISPPGFEQYFEELSAGLAAAGDSTEAAMRIRKALSAKYDIEVVGPPRQAKML